MAATSQTISAVRNFNRSYTRHIGLLREGHLDSRFTLTEARVLFELAKRKPAVAVDLAHDLGLDPGYLSRILLRFQTAGLLTRARSERDGRQRSLLLTRAGKAAVAALDERSNQEAAGLLDKLAPAEQQRLVTAMKSIDDLLNREARDVGTVTLRRPQPGDLGWLIHRHGVLYAAEFGWGERFEALVAQIAAAIVQKFDPKHERCWIAEDGEEILGSVYLVRHSPKVAKLRLLWVEPSARGLGLGTRLVSEAVQFAREHGYAKVSLWTQSDLKAAQRIYIKLGFSKVAEEPHAQFGIAVTGQTWELRIGPSRGCDQA